MCHLYIYISVAFIVSAATMFMVNKDYHCQIFIIFGNNITEQVRNQKFLIATKHTAENNFVFQ